MAEWIYNEEEIRRSLAALGERPRVAFVLSCGERMLPNYRAFVREVGWGNARALRAALDVGWAWLRGEALPTNMAGLKSACDIAAPDTEDFDSLLVSPALDAANVARLVLDLVTGGDAEKAVEAALLARDTVDMYVQEIAQIPSGDGELEERIRLHPLMQAEIARQTEDLAILAGSWNEADIRRSWSSPMRSNIGLG